MIIYYIKNMLDNKFKTLSNDIVFKNIFLEMNYYLSG